KALEQMQRFRIGPLFTPPSLRGTLQRPGQGGGGSWGGAAFDPETGYLIVRATRGVGLYRVGKNDGSDPLVEGAYSNRFVRGGEDVSVSGLPLTAPPYAVLTALDLNRGEKAWRCRIGWDRPTIGAAPWRRKAAWCSSAAATVISMRSRPGPAAKSGARR